MALVVWQLLDGKRGHERQSDGLIAALASYRNIDRHPIHIDRCRPTQAWHAMLGRFPDGRDKPDPDLIIGAGSACHFALVAARRARGGRSVCLMRPGLPWRWFDVCVVPRHDHPPAATNVFTSEGVLNPMHPAASRDEDLAMILLGGPSAHHVWNTSAVVAQIRSLTRRAPDLRWVVTDSRRSPADLAPALRGLSATGVQYMSAADCAPEWLSEQLSRAGQAWVSSDSVAMIFEALSAGARVGLIELETRRADRITAIGPDLHARGWVGSCAADKPLPNPIDLNEADRCARWLLDQFALPEPGGRVSV